MEGVALDHGVVDDGGAAALVLVVDPPAGDDDDRGDGDLVAQLTGEPFGEGARVGLGLGNGLIGGDLGEVEALAVVADFVVRLLVGVEGLAARLRFNDEHAARAGDHVVDVKLFARALEDEVVVNAADFRSPHLPVERLADVALAIEPEAVGGDFFEERSQLHRLPKAGEEQDRQRGDHEEEGPDVELRVGVSWDTRRQQKQEYTQPCEHEDEEQFANVVPLQVFEFAAGRLTGWSRGVVGKRAGGCLLFPVVEERPTGEPHSRQAEDEGKEYADGH